MTNLTTRFLRRNHLNLSKIHNQTGISMSTLSNTFKRPVQTWKVGIIQSLAKLLHTNAGSVLNALSNHSWHLTCNDKKHTIQGVQVPRDGYDNVKSTVITECYEGWQPNKHDIKLLVRSYNHPDPDIMDNIKRAKEFVNDQK